MGITLKQSLPEDKSYQPEDGLAPVLSPVSPNTISKVLCAYFSFELPEYLTVVLAVTDVFSQYWSPQGRGV